MKMNNPYDFFYNMNQMGMQMLNAMKPMFNNEYTERFKQQTSSFCNMAQNMKPNMEELNQLNKLMANYTAQMFAMTKQMTETMYKQNIAMLEGMNEIFQKNFETKFSDLEAAQAEKKAAPKTKKPAAVKKKMFITGKQ